MRIKFEIHGKTQMPVYDSSDRFILDICLYIEDATHLILLSLFCLKKTIYIFWSCFILLQVKLVKKNQAPKGTLLSPQDSYKGDKVANEIYLIYLHFCGRASMWIFIYCRCKTGSKCGFKKKWGLARDTNNNFVGKYLVKTGSPRYLGTTQENIFLKSDSILGLKFTRFWD